MTAILLRCIGCAQAHRIKFRAPYRVLKDVRHNAPTYRAQLLLMIGKYFRSREVC